MAKALKWVAYKVVLILAAVCTAISALVLLPTIGLIRWVDDPWWTE